MDTTAKPPVKFNLSFTPQLEEYSKIEKPTVKGFANIIGCDVFDLWAWANKKKKDEKGQLTDQLARPKFHQALTNLDKIEKENKPEIFTNKQEVFCILYATDSDICGNGTKCYLKAYGLDEKKEGTYQTAMVNASKLLSETKILERINQLLSAQGFNDVFVDNQLMSVIKQHDDRGAKVAAIREYNKLRQRITDKIDHTTNGKELPTPIYGNKSTE